MIWRLGLGRIDKILHPFQARQVGYLLIFGLLGCILLASWPYLSAFERELKAARVLDQYVKNLEPEANGFACLALPLTRSIDGATIRSAIEQLNQVTRVFPHQAHLYYLIGRGYCLVGDYAAAVMSLPRFTELRPANPQADLELGFALEKLCPPKGECAEMTMAQVWRRAGVTPEQLIANGEALRKKEDFAAARAWYKRAEALGADLRSTLYFLEYQKALKEGHESEAYAALERAIQADAGWVDGEIRFVAWYRYGRYQYEKVKDITHAEQSLKTAISIFPNNSKLNNMLSEAFRLVGIILFQQQLVQEAEPYLSKAIEVSPRNVSALVAYGKWLYSMDSGNGLQAQDYFKRALLISSKDLNLWKQLINFWVKAGEKSFAQEICELAGRSGINVSNLENCP